MALKDYETRSDPFTEKEDDFDPGIYADGSAELMGAFYTRLANSLARIEAASMKNERLKNKMEAMEHPNVYQMLINYPHLMKEVRESMKSDIVKPWDEDNLMDMYMDKIAEMTGAVESVYPEKYIKLMHRILPCSIASYYEAICAEEADNHCDCDYDPDKDDIQF